MDTRSLELQHRVIIRRAIALKGMSGMVRAPDDSREALGLIEAIDQLLVEHLTIEDQVLYPALLDAPDAATRAFAADCIEEMGGILDVWVHYREQWTAERILADPRRFHEVTGGVVGALASRVEKEDAELYPAMDALMAARAGRDAA
ncbi:hemerythrin domain-containing protein [Brevundimonas sp.]|uniref:hemerythrin domain-containing protein n=1 Tax=Brevundimonas sp. TaxID=1871086 RepID=UPI003D6CE1FF